MSTKHTPGPWRVDRAESLKSEWTCYADDCAQSTWQPISDGAGNAVALVVDASQRYSDRPSFDADARLIAAAPDLLGALLRAKRHLSVYSEEFDMAERAIAKATGEQA